MAQNTEIIKKICFSFFLKRIEKTQYWNERRT